VNLEEYKGEEIKQKRNHSIEFHQMAFYHYDYFSNIYIIVSKSVEMKGDVFKKNGLLQPALLRHQL
jgi:hypothetical protein